MKKGLLIIITLFIFTACNHASVADTQEESGSIGAMGYSNETDPQQPDYDNLYQTLNHPIFGMDAENPFMGATEDDIYEYSEEVKGEYLEVAYKGELFPPKLIHMMEEALYHSCNYEQGELIMMEHLENDYFDTVKRLGAEDYEAKLDDLYEAFPKLNKHKKEFHNQYEAYKYLSGSENCIDLFHAKLSKKEEYYIFVFDSGGSKGTVKVELAKLLKGKLVKVCSFLTQNNGFGTVIRYKDNYYYVFLQYNYNLKNYDGIRLHKLGPNAKKENILIRYLPEKYIWKNVYRNQAVCETDVDDYINGIKDMVTTEGYIENGINGMSCFIGDETEDRKFKGDDEWYSYYKMDFANLGIPVYFRKTIFEPSNYRSTMHLKASFYLYDESNQSVMELNGLQINSHLPTHGNELIQMWFKEIGNKVFTFRIYHTFDYNYVFNVALVEGGNVTQVRNDILSPSKRFVLTEGKVFTK